MLELGCDSCWKCPARIGSSFVVGLFGQCTFTCRQLQLGASVCDHQPLAAFVAIVTDRQARRTNYWSHIGCTVYADSNGDRQQDIAPLLEPQ